MMWQSAQSINSEKVVAMQPVEKSKITSAEQTTLTKGKNPQ